MFGKRPPSPEVLRISWSLKALSFSLAPSNSLGSAIFSARTCGSAVRAGPCARRAMIVSEISSFFFSPSASARAMSCSERRQVVVSLAIRVLVRESRGQEVSFWMLGRYSCSCWTCAASPSTPVASSFVLRTSMVEDMSSDKRI